MAYTRVNWEDLPSTATPRNAANLNKMDKGIKDLEESLSGVATSGSYGDLSNKPQINSVELSGNKTLDNIGVPPKSHASTTNAYGLGSTSNYGHCKTINNLTTSSHSDGDALSAYQGYVLSERNTYSTTEKAIGKWIDGKTLYRKVLQANSLNTGSETQIATGVSNIDTVVFIYGIVKQGNARQPLLKPHNSSFNYQLGVYYDKSTNKIKVETGSGLSNLSETFVIIEYTKTS